VKDRPSPAFVRELLNELSVLATELGPGESEDYVRISLERVVAAVVERRRMNAAAGRLSRSLELLERQRGRGPRRTQQRGSADLQRMRRLVDSRLVPALIP
jgi:hypothetical protein